ncbi:hypothetical protein HHK36_018544 [Tetracentron sinense]|uniref:Uncharacterized protein n=1 Tax=Tetracentron sinense TaxID=13715 RepID=A0A834YW60_TETSI|nr:hypothetical protein HHK36_018544 [Tetracentron sinense]
MVVKVAATCLHWSQPVVPHSPTSAQTLASSVSSPSSKKRSRSDLALFSLFIHRSDRSALFGTPSTNLLRTRSCDTLQERGHTLRRASSASLDGLSDDEFFDKIQELAIRFHVSDENENNNHPIDAVPDKEGESSSNSNKIAVENRRQFPPSKLVCVEPSWLGIRPEPLEWPEIDESIPASIERKANSVDLPLSLRIIKKKKQWQEGFKEAGDSAYCSIKKAFSSMVFIIQEIHSYSLQMREILLFEDLQGILTRVQKEMHASFVWLFQQVFSQTPTLMVYVMILLANFTVHSMANNTAIAAPFPPESYAATSETVLVSENQSQNQPKLDSSAIKTFSVSSSAGKTASISGDKGGGGGKVRGITNGTDGGDGRFDRWSSSNNHHTILPSEISQASSFGNPTKEAGSQEVITEEEVKIWNSIAEEASRMKAELRDEAFDQETIQRLVSPVKVEIEQEDYTDYIRTELFYQMGLSQEPNNPLLLCNYAQFLYLVSHDHDRAEDYFKRAIQVEPPDAESFSRYASFLWEVRKDMEAAEETYLEAIAADPGNSAHAANYAHFLWNTGGEDTCYLLDDSNDYA